MRFAAWPATWTSNIGDRFDISPLVAYSPENDFKAGTTIFHAASPAFDQAAFSNCPYHAVVFQGSFAIVVIVSPRYLQGYCFCDLRVNAGESPTFDLVGACSASVVHFE